MRDIVKIAALAVAVLPTFTPADVRTFNEYELGNGWSGLLGQQIAAMSVSYYCEARLETDSATIKYFEGRTGDKDFRELTLTPSGITPLKWKVLVFDYERASIIDRLLRGKVKQPLQSLEISRWHRTIALSNLITDADFADYDAARIVVTDWRDFTPPSDTQPKEQDGGDELSPEEEAAMIAERLESGSLFSSETGIMEYVIDFNELDAAREALEQQCMPSLRAYID